MIRLTLLQPGKELPVQQWTFEAAEKINIGRSSENEVVLYSVVVSRRHLSMVKNEKGEWIVKSTGVNGTYIEGEPVTKMVAYDGMIMRLAGSGPQIQINIQTDIHFLNLQLSKMLDTSNVLTSSQTKLEDEFIEVDKEGDLNSQFLLANREKASSLIS